jgi:F-type H+-transporting ATPase subunit gamma
MSNGREIKFRIKSVGSIFKVTKAMGAVAASRMRKAQEQTLRARPYILRAIEILALLRFYGLKPEVFPLISERKIKNVGVLLVTPDRGLCGGLVGNLLKAAADYKEEQEKFGRKVTFIVIGRKGAAYLKRINADIMAVFPDKSFWRLIDAGTIHKLVMDSFLSGRFDAVDIIYSNFISPVKQKAVVRPILPLTPKNLEKLVETRQLDKILSHVKYPLLYQIEPDKNVLAKELIPHLIKMGMYFLLLETKASEYSARMLAMENARKNAEELIADLTLNFNKVRQAQITSQIAEIVGGAAALEE